MLTVPLSASPANAVDDVVPSANVEYAVLPANAVEDDVPSASTVLAVFAVIALAWPEVIPVLSELAVIQTA